MVRGIDLKRLRYFVAVADELHFGRAAERLHIAQPPLSQQIRRLEGELGLALFERSTRRVTLTDAGRLLHPEAQRLVGEADALERRMDQVRRGDGGVLRLGFVDSSSYEVMPRFVRSYRSRWPAVDYELTSMSSDEQHAALIAGEIDVGVARTIGGAGVHATTFLRERLVAAVGADHRFAGQKSTSLSRLAGDSFIGFDRSVSPSLHAELRTLLSDRGVTYAPIIEATEYTTILGLVASGQGIAIVPASVRTFRPPNLRYLDLNHREATSSLMLLSRPADRSPLVARAVALVTEVFRQ